MPTPPLTPTPPLNIEQQILLCHQVAQLVRAKLPLIGELSRTARQLAPHIASPALEVEQQLASGKSLSMALAGDSSRNSQILSACIEAGERANVLDKTLQLWASMHIDNARSSKDLRTAMIYPALLIVVTLVSLSFVIWKIIPDYRSTYELFSHDMPSWLEAIVTVRE